MTEHLAFHQVFRDRPAVDGDEGAGDAVAATVNLASDQLFAGAGFAGDHHADVGAGDFLQLAEDLHHARTDADDFAETLVLQLGAELLLVGTKSGQEHRVLQNQRSLAREDRQQIELPSIEQVFHLVVADVERADHFALIQERYAHHARELERNHALALAEHRVVQRVADDDRAPGFDHLAHDAVADRAGRVLDRLVFDVAGGAQPRRAVFTFVGVHEQHDATRRAGELDQVVEQLLEQLVDRTAGHQSFAEPVQPLQARNVTRCLFLRGSRPFRTGPP